MTEESPTVVQATAVPNNLYVGTNVVNRHIFEFFDLAANQMLMSEGEQALAIFDCVILDENGRRLGGLTLHDYIILTDKNLVTWGRGRSKDIIDKFGWNDVALDKFGRRTPIEGVIKVLYKSQPVNNRKRRISVRANNEATVSNPDDKIRPATPSGGVSLYLDLMPAGDVRPCVEMMRYLMGVNEGTPSAEGFQNRFRTQILEAQRRQADIALVFQPFYVDAGNGMLIEKDDEEERLYRSVPRRVTARAERVAPASPYRNNGVSTSRGVNSPYRGSSTQVRANRMPASLPTRTANVNVSMDVAESPASGAVLNRGNRRTTTGAPGKEFGESGLGSTVSLSNQPFSGPSKLESYENRARGGTTNSRLESVSPPRSASVAPRPEPAPRPAPAPRDPVARPVPPTPTQTRERIKPANTDLTAIPENRSRSLTPPVVERLVPERANFERPLSMPIGVAIPRELLNIYNISRLARGLWIQPQNLVRNAGDLSETVGVLGDLTNLIAVDPDARRLAISRLKYAVDRGPLARNLILHYTIWPFIKPLVDLVALPGSYEAAQTYNRVVVRADETGTLEGDPNLPDMGVVAANDSPVPAARPVPMPRVSPPSGVPPVPMPRVSPSSDVPPVPMPRPSTGQPTPQKISVTAEPPTQTIANRTRPQPPAEPIAPKRQPIGDLGIGEVAFGDRNVGQDNTPTQTIAVQSEAKSVVTPPTPKSKLGDEEMNVSATDMQDSTATPPQPAPPPPTKTKLGQDF